MTPTPRKSGIRLPWSRDEDLEESDAPDASSDPSTETTAMTPAPTAGETVELAAPAVSAMTPAEEPASSGAAGDRADLLASLVAAMREVADRERETSLAGLRGSVESAIETLRERASAGADDLRRRAETDIAGIGDWVKFETERIVAEGDRKIESRRQQLTQQLTDHEQGSQHEIESLHDRVGEYERELASFFAQLHEIDDPAAFGAAAKRMPQPPTLAGQAWSAGANAAAPATAPVAEASALATPATRAAQEEAPPTRAEDEAALVANHRTRLDALGLTREESAAEESAGAAVEADEPASERIEAGTAATTDEPAAADDSPLRARLAELDAAIAPEEASSGLPASPERGGEVATAIVVHGLGSFGAITSFKQTLERVDGVHGISLALGPTGEFVYRATHDSDFDVVAAIEQIENGAAQIDKQADGSLRVTVQRAR